MNSRYFNAQRKKAQRTQAAALMYDPKKTVAPEVVAFGKGLRAQEIVELAQKHNIPIHENAGLVEALSRLEIGSEIPPDLYVIVAEILAFVYAIDGKNRS